MRRIGPDEDGRSRRAAAWAIGRIGWRRSDPFHKKSRRISPAAFGLNGEPVSSPCASAAPYRKGLRCSKSRRP
ncbi:MAG TPA: hypothetical protein DIC56_05690 [Rhizobium sp.]|nr:hypothetical protein [Rhizobium sp.]